MVSEQPQKVREGLGAAPVEITAAERRIAITLRIATQNAEANECIQ
jgi:hypothetical protein